jgi:hypothetical protein
MREKGEMRGFLAAFRAATAATGGVAVWALGTLAATPPGDLAFAAIVADAARALWLAIAVTAALILPAAAIAEGWRPLALAVVATLAVPAPLIAIVVLMEAIAFAPSLRAAAVLVLGVVVFAGAAGALLRGLSGSPLCGLARGTMQLSAAGGLVVYHRQILERLLS